MAKQLNGHISTKETKALMPEILTSTYEDEDTGEILPTYTVLQMGKNWQQRQYQNNKTHNVFWGEPDTGSVPPFVAGFESEGLKWNITYSFKGIRNNIFGYSIDGEPIVYGADNMTMDRLYYILVNAFNDGVDFVQTYLNDCAPFRLGDELKRVINPALEKYKSYVSGKEEEIRKQEILKSDIKKEEKKYESDLRCIEEYENIIDEGKKHLTKSSGYTEINKNIKYKGNNKRYAGLKLWEAVKKARTALKRAVTSKFKRSQKLEKFYSDLGSGKIKIRGKTWNTESERISEILRSDFINCLESGIITLSNRIVSENTKKQRIKAGLPPDPKFFASGQFAESIDFSVRIYSNGK